MVHFLHDKVPPLFASNGPYLSRLFHKKRINTVREIHRYNLTGHTSLHTGILENFFKWDAGIGVDPPATVGAVVTAIIDSRPYEQDLRRSRPRLIEAINVTAPGGVSRGGGATVPASVPRYFVERYDRGDFAEAKYRAGMPRQAKLALKASVLLVCGCSVGAQWEVNVLG